MKDAMDPKVYASTNSVRKPSYIRANNCMAVLSALRASGTLTMGDISKRIKLSKTTVSKIVLLLMQKGLLVENGKGASSEEGGKKPDLFSINANHRYALVLGFDKDKVECIVYDMVFQTICKIDEQNSPDISYPKAIELSVAICQKAIEKAGISPQSLLGIAFNFAGIVDTATGVIRYPILFPQWGDRVPFCEDFSKAFAHQIPTYVVNYSHMSGYMERMGEIGKKYRTFAVIYINPHTQGVGGCVVENGRMITGENGFAGEFGHMIVDPGTGTQCKCGSYGCLEVAVSPAEIVKNAKKNMENFKDSPLYPIVKTGHLLLRELFDAADSGDSFARFLVDDTVPYYAACLRNIIIVYDPDAIIIQRPPLAQDSYFISALREAIIKTPFFQQFPDTKILVSPLDESLSDLHYCGSALYLNDMYLSNETLYRV